MVRWIPLGLAALLVGAFVVFFGQLTLFIFAAILVASVLDAFVQIWMRLLPVPRLVALLVTLLVVVLCLVAGVVFGSIALPDQLEALRDILSEAWRVVAGQLSHWGIPAPETFSTEEVLDALPTPQTMFGSAGVVLGQGVGVLTNLAVILLIGVFLAIDPPRYRDGLVLLFPIAYRARMSTVFDRAGATLQRWSVGQLALMAIVGGLTLILLMAVGVAYALPLALIAGLLNFIPFLGPILAFVPIGMSMIGQDWTTALIVLAGYTFIQQLDSNLFTPLIQDRVVNLAPALTVAFLMFMGIAYGIVGIVLATPLLAALRVMVLELYVTDLLGDPEGSREGSRVANGDKD